MTPHTTAHVPKFTGQNKLNIRNLTLIALMTAVLCVLGPWAFTFPFSPIPLSLGTLGIYFIAMILGAKYGTISVLLYILLGLVGLPVFTGFMGGPAKVFGPTGGYLLGYILMALICGFAAEKFAGKYVLCFLGMGLGTIVCYLLGTVWLAYQLDLSFAEAFVIGVLPYIFGDLVKMILATAIGIRLRKYLLRANLIG